MNLSRTAAVALAILLVTAGAVAAAPGNAPAFAGNDDAQADDNRQDDDNRPDHAGSAGDDRPDAANTSDSAADAADAADAAVVDDRGPPVELPAPVPDHVSEIHDLIRQYIAGDLGGSLGNAVADVTPGGADAES